MERHGRDLEAEAGKQKDEAEDKANAGLPRRIRDAGKRDRAGKAIDQGRPIKQHAGRQCAKHEIFQPRLSRGHGVAIDCRHNVERETHQLEAEI